jgi:hypothetical protein
VLFHGHHRWHFAPPVLLQLLLLLLPQRRCSVMLPLRLSLVCLRLLEGGQYMHGRHYLRGWRRAVVLLLLLLLLWRRSTRIRLHGRLVWLAMHAR